MRLGITPLTASFLKRALRRFASEARAPIRSKMTRRKRASGAPDPASLAGTSTRHASVSDLHETRAHRLSTMNHAAEDATESESVFLLPSQQFALSDSSSAIIPHQRLEIDGSSHDATVSLKQD